MSSRGSPLPPDLSDSPSSPFQPVLPSSTSRRPLVRRPVRVSSAQLPPTSGRPFGEIGREDEEPDNSDAVSVMSASTIGGATTEGTNAFVPLYRDVRQRRPVVRKATMAPPEQKAAAEQAAPQAETAASSEQEAEVEGDAQRKPVKVTPSAAVTQQGGAAEAKPVSDSKRENEGKE